MEKRFAGKHVVVIASGFALAGPEDIGTASAIAFAAEGATVAVVQFVKAKADECVVEITNAGGSAVAFTADPRDPHSLDPIVAELTSNWPSVDVLVTHHFASVVKTVEETTLEEWEGVLRANLTGVFVAVKGFLPLLKNAAGASIVNVGSVDGTLGNPNVPAMSAAKGGVHALSHVLAGELSRYGIRVNCIARAASTLVPLTGNVFEQVNNATPLARAGTPDEYAQAVLFLASEQASYITGVVLPVDAAGTAVTPGCSPNYAGYLNWVTP